ncbi:WD40 repeat-like protein [Coniochaeta hoffmannii]|uniref:WD40 repeat-like protein n=1 Tax=Coniochaeta hoffmannii TaxID=91930 RepID=A0AA38VPI8_9PEZI|nr:WD40 repeat-like protein [Coniochaeta hoffmannii]
MAPLLRPRASLQKDKFATYFAPLNSQLYSDIPPSARGVQATIRSIAWSPLGNLVATGSANKTLRVWNPEKANVRFSTELKGHAAAIHKVAFNPIKDGELASVSDDGVVKFWDVRTKNCTSEVKGLGDAFTLVWAPDGESLIVGNKSDKLFILSPTQSTPISSHQQSVQTNQIAFDWSGNKIFVTTGEGQTRILSYPGLEPVLRLDYAVDPDDGKGKEFKLTGHTSSCVTAELQPTGRYLATGGTDSIIALWDTTDWICHRTLTKMSGPVRSISFTFDGSYIAGGSDEEAGVHVWHTETGEHLYTFKSRDNSPVVAWAPTRYCLAYSENSVGGGLRIAGVETDRK